MLNLKKNGDLLERIYYDDLITKLPQYEEFWKCFIGNDGNAKIIKSNSTKIDDKRKFIAQYSYTILESLVCLFRITTKNSKIENLDTYLDANNDFMLFQTHCGRIRDCVHKIGIKLSIKRLEFGLENFYKRRNQILHGKKIPFTIIEDMFVLPLVEGVDFESKMWKDELLWENIKELELEIVNEVYTELFNELISCLNSIYSQMLSKINEDSELDFIITMMKNYTPIGNSYVTVSGITENHFMTERFVSSSYSLISGSVVK